MPRWSRLFLLQCLFLLLAACLWPIAADAVTDTVIGQVTTDNWSQFDISGNRAAWISSDPWWTQAVTIYDVLTTAETVFSTNQYSTPEGSVRISGTLMANSGYGWYDYGTGKTSFSIGWYEINDLASLTNLFSTYPTNMGYMSLDIDGTLMVRGPYPSAIDWSQLTRAGMCYLVACGLAGGEANVPAGPVTPSFADVPTDHWAYKYIEYVVLAGVVMGYGDSTFRPDLAVDRGQMAVYVSRSEAGGDANVPNGPPTPTFPDVPSDHWAFKYIEYLNTIVTYAAYSTSPLLFAPEHFMDPYLAASWVEQALGTPVDPSRIGGGALAPLYVLNTGTWDEHQITSASACAESPAVNEGRVVWQDYRNGTWDIYIYDVGPDGVCGTADDIGETRVTASTAHEKNPAISGRLIVWEDNRTGDWQIHVYDLGPDGIFGTADDGGETALTAGAYDHQHVTVSGRLVAWEDSRNTGWDVYVYGLGPDGIPSADDVGETRVTAILGDYHYPRLDGDRLLYIAPQGYYYSDVHLYDMHTYVLAPDFTATPLTGDRPLQVTFTDLSLNPQDLAGWTWDFGDGYTSTERNPVHVYETAGTYDVSLTIWCASVSKAITKADYIVVGEPGIARIRIQHPSPFDLVVEIGTGDPNNPTWSKQVWKYGYSDANLDLSVDLLPAVAQLPPSTTHPWFVRVADAWPGDTGSITSFEIERHGTIYQAANVPQPIPDDGGFVYLWIPGITHTFALDPPTASPNPVYSGGAVALKATYNDTLGHAAILWQWTDGGAGGSFWPGAQVQNPSYLAPANTTGADITVTLTVSATCGGNPSGSATKSAVLTVTYDMDGDGLPDIWEKMNGLDPTSATDAAADADNDGLTNLQEFQHGTNPLVADTDSDGMPDGWEVTYSLNPRLTDAALDKDNDGLTNIAEYQTGTNPSNRDTDNDGFGDGEEVSLGSNPADPNSKPNHGHFTDVPVTGYGDQGTDAFWAFHYIEAAFRSGIVTGFPDGSYQPTLPVTRDQMAVYVARALAGSDDRVPGSPTKVSFPDDVPSTHWAYKYIEYAVSQGVVQGYDATHYRPDVVVDRGQMAVFVARARGWVKLGEAMNTAPELFPDVPAGFWSGTAIKACIDNAVVKGYDDNTYRPGDQVTRDQMAVYIVRAFNLAM